MNFFKKLLGNKSDAENPILREDKNAKGENNSFLNFDDFILNFKKKYDDENFLSFMKRHFPDSALSRDTMNAWINANAKVTKEVLEQCIDKHEALGVAAGQGVATATLMLVEYGADPNRFNDKYHAPLFIATEKNKNVIVEYFIKFTNANVNLRSKNGVTPLLVAARNGNLELIKIFIEKGADINAKANDNTSILEAAFHSKSTPILKYLLEAGIDIKSTDIAKRLKQGWIMRIDWGDKITFISRIDGPNSMLEKFPMEARMFQKEEVNAILPGMRKSINNSTELANCKIDAITIFDALIDYQRNTRKK